MANEKRLIDANLLVEFVGTRTSTWIYKPDLFWAIEQQPTVDAVEVVHGEWRTVGDACVCSVCHKWAVQDYDYCPNCGAKMDGDGNG